MTLATLLLTLVAPFSGWWADSKMPLPREPKVTVAPCPAPAPPGASCAIASEGTHRIFMHPDHFNGRRPRAVFMHEVGHLWDYEHLTSRDRAWFGNDGEQIASAYSLCAIKRRIRERAIGWMSMWWPTPAEHRKACRVLRP